MKYTVAEEHRVDWRDVATDYDRGAAGFDARFASDPRTEPRFRSIEAPMLRAIAGAARVLDLGCGTGRVLAAIDAPIRVGLDVSSRLLERAAERRAARPILVRGDAHHLPFRDASLDAVVAANAVFRYLDRDVALIECARVLRAGGVLALHQYAASVRSLSFRRRPASPLHLGSLDEIRAPAARAGFVEDEVHLFRNLRVWPFAVRIPEAIAVPLRIWSHVVFVFRRSPRV